MTIFSVILKSFQSMTIKNPGVDTNYQGCGVADFLGVVRLRITLGV